MSKTTFAYPADAPVITMTRTFDAPRELVWRVITEPEHVVRWFGPTRHTNHVRHMAVRPGGTWRFETELQGGGVVVFTGEYREVVAPERLVQTFGVEGMFDGRVAVETATLEDLGGQTRYAVLSRFESLADRDGMVASGMESGATESMDSIAAILDELQAAAVA
ncbi:MAG TPA: SRPBCC domain-containing protein [Longimicrobium sp.]|nr:SRPBCC domain-containing protein [Longimicrobium sp.]